MLERGGYSSSRENPKHPVRNLSKGRDCKVLVKIVIFWGSTLENLGKGFVIFV